MKKREIEHLKRLIRSWYYQKLINKIQFDEIKKDIDIYIDLNKEC